MPLTTPDGRYIVVRGRLWRASNPNLSAQDRKQLVHDLMDARRAVKAAKAMGDPDAENEAHQAVDDVKRKLGERGPVWGAMERRISTATWRTPRPMPGGMRGRAGAGKARGWSRKPQSRHSD